MEKDDILMRLDDEQIRLQVAQTKQPGCGGGFFERIKSRCQTTGNQSSRSSGSTGKDKSG